MKTYPVKSKERIELEKAFKGEPVEAPKRPFMKESKPNSHGLVSHLWNDWKWTKCRTK
jgi:hypothetical protein